ncbi:hypothetical protein HMF8227_01861 [Saliniradius amylolyticus]|uniref:Major facilitator superfamily (MFS) profile domain-containing protein n=1 Tax=Saliniradius amylolyticus TaxID=2183582 RepID=A0A2S2E3V3_9ALTE|nr:MFS transporter [Saliniradius amylolyticus]AWL12331.1 hypothetical protein HMF8227_01861 [Saliniradius amylolyticus]
MKIEKLYQIVDAEHEGRTCKDLDDKACQRVPGNFLLICASLIMTKLGDLLASPKIVLSWLLGSAGAAPGIISLLVPIRESGSLVPQLAIGAWVRRHPKRKGFWVIGSVIQGMCVALMAVSLWTLSGNQAGFAVLGLLVLFSLARGMCSVSIKDVQGKTIPKGRRGRLSGLASSVSGALTVVIGLAFFSGDEDPTLAFYTLLLALAAVLWLFAAVVFSLVEEEQGETQGGNNALKDALKNLTLLKTDAHFRAFVIARALLMGSALSAPFVLLLAQNQSASPHTFAAFLIASSLGTSLSATIWGWLADDSSRKVMFKGGLFAALAALAVLAVDLSQISSNIYLYAGLYLLLSIAHAGVRIGRQTYIVDMADGVKRTDYVSVSNSVIGLLLLVVGLISAGFAALSTHAALAFLGLMGLVGSIWTYRLPEVSE